MAASNGTLIDEINTREAARRAAAHIPPCPHLKALIWTISIGLTIALIVIAGNTAMVQRVSQRQDTTAEKTDTNRGDIREIKTDIKYIREAVARIEARAPKP